MLEQTVFAPAKINLTLDVVGKRDDGYHLIQTIMQAVDYADTVTVRLTKEAGIRLRVSDSRLPTDRRNTAWRAAAAFLDAVGEKGRGVEIAVQKAIPMEAGLAGGSADAAGVLTALNRLMDTRLTPDELCSIGEAVGADVPFCVLGGAASAEGIGTILSPLPSMPPCWLVIAKPDRGVSTAEAYRLVDRAEIPRRPRPGAVADALCAGDLDTIGRELCNVFETALALPEVAQIEEIMRQFDTLGCRMTGSGSAVYGIFEGKTDAQRCARRLKEEVAAVQICRPCATGPFLVEKSLEKFV